MADNPLMPSFGLQEFTTYELFAPRLNRSIYHYTTIAGAVGIITSKSIWLTKIQHLNDSREVLHAIDLAQTTSKTVDLSELTPGASRLLQDLVGRLRSATDINICVACFCEERDLLSRWRGYAVYSRHFAGLFEPRALTTAAEGRLASVPVRVRGIQPGADPGLRFGLPSITPPLYMRGLPPLAVKAMQAAALPPVLTA